MSKWDKFTKEELCELGRGLGWAENEGSGSDLMDKLDAEIDEALNKLSNDNGRRMLRGWLYIVKTQCVDVILISQIIKDIVLIV